MNNQSLSLSHGRLQSPYYARFEGHGDNDVSEISPGVEFVKTWKLINNGQLPWPNKIQLVFLSKITGDQMCENEAFPFNYIRPVKVGERATIQITLRAPSQPGEYSGFWKLADENGKKFGQRFRVKILVRLPEAQIPEKEMPYTSAAVQSQTGE